MSRNSSKPPSGRLQTSNPTDSVQLQFPEAVLPQRLGNEFDGYPKLSREQCGHLRHFHNIASQFDGDFAFMGAQEPGQEWDTAYRYQYSAMAYASGAAHYHHLPIMRSMFKSLIYKLIQKMLRREVWGYWYLSSQSGVRVDPDLKELRKPWADPVCKENIMYSGHLLLMVSLYSMLFNDDSFDKPDAIIFDWSPMFWGMGPETFSYTRSTLQEAILKEMEREGWMGVCCEPNMIFIICNQFPIIAMRYNDIRNKTSIADEVVAKYRAAWTKKANGMVADNGLFRRWYAPGQKQALDSDEISHTAWAMAFMPWNNDMVKSMYTSTGIGFLHRVNNRINVHPPVVANAIRRLVANGNTDLTNVTLQAQELTRGEERSMRRYLSPAFGYIAQWISEIAGPPDLDSLLLHADSYFRPSWSKGGLYYPRCDSGWDESGNYTFMDPYTGNAAIGYARLNVKGGQKKMWDHPWSKEEVESRPWIDNLGLEQDVDCLRGVWDDEKKALIASFRTWDGQRRVVHPVVNNLPIGTFGVYINSELTKTVDVALASTQVNVDLVVSGEEVDLILLRS